MIYALFQWIFAFFVVTHTCFLSIGTDVDECLYNNGNCSHDCINTQGSYYCECPTGYILQPNRRDCAGEYYTSG